MRGQHVTQYSVLFLLYVVDLLALASTALVLLWRKLHQAHGPDRIRLPYFFTGVVLTTGTLLLTHLLLPLVFGITAYLIPGTLGLLFLTSMLYFAVVREDFPSFSRTLISIASSLLAFLGTFLLFYLVANCAAGWFHSLHSTSAVSCISFCCFLVVGMVPPATRLMQRLVARLFHDTSAQLAALAGLWAGSVATSGSGTRGSISCT